MGGGDERNRRLLTRVRHAAVDLLGWAQDRWKSPPAPVLTGSPWWDSNPHFRLSQDRSLSVEIQRRPQKFSAPELAKKIMKFVLCINLACERVLDVLPFNEMI